jgi:hypothetical protein
MPIINVTYNNNKNYIGVYKRPLADVVLIGPTRRVPISAVKVDSGADLVQFPQASGILAGLLSPRGILPPGATRRRINTAGGIGNPWLIQLPGVSIEVEGILIPSVDVLFHPNGNTPALLGMNAIIALTNVGFNTTDWLWQ